MKKVFVLPLFGRPFGWEAEYLAAVRFLEPYGWYWKILTPYALPSGGNVEIVPMTLVEFDARVRERCGVTSGNYLTTQGVPAKLLSDYYPAFGDLFADLLTDADYWSATNWDIVYGRLDHFLPDSELGKYELWSDDNHHINSLCCCYKNVPRITQLYRSVPDWEQMFQWHGQALYGFDEGYFSALVRSLADHGELAFGHPPYFALHSYDRLVQHQPTPNLTRAPDGALLECFEDHFPGIANYLPWRGYFGREIMYFHFLRTKRWPTLRPYAP